MSERNVKETIPCPHSSHQSSILMWWNCRAASLAFLWSRGQNKRYVPALVLLILACSVPHQRTTLFTLVSSTDTFWDQLESYSPCPHVHTCTTVTGIESSLAPAPRHGSPHVFPFPSRLSPRHRTGAFLSGISSLHGARYLLLLVPICGTRCAGHDVLPLATRGPPLHRARPSNCFNSLQNV